MMLDLMDDAVVATVRDFEVSLRFTDGSTAGVPMNVVSRSTVLRQAIDSAGTDSKIVLTTPKGVLESWVQCIDALKFGFIVAETAPRTHDGAESRLVEFIKAADFLDDQTALAQLCEIAGAWLFSPQTYSADRQESNSLGVLSSPCLSEDRVQVIRELPDNVLVSVLAAAPKPMPEQVTLLPHAFHKAALHAAYPSILAERSLTLDCTTQTCSTVTVLWQYLENITCLQLQGSKSSIISLAPQLTSLSDLLRLHLHSRNMGPDGASALAPHLGHLTSLQHLHLRCNSLGDDGAKALAPYIARLLSLQHLDLGLNSIGAEGAKVLAPGIAQLQRLQHLCLDYNRIGTTIKRFRVRCRFTASGVRTVRNSVHQAPCMCAEGAEALVAHLGCLTLLQHLDLGLNHIGAKSVQVWGHRITSLASLLHLELYSNLLGSEGASALAQHLISLTALQYLGLGYNSVGCKGAEALAPSLAGLAHLQRLNLGYNEIGAYGTKALVHHLARLSSLRYVGLRGNLCMGDEAREEVTSKLCAVEHIDL